MLVISKMLGKFLQFLISLMFILQIALMVLLFLTASYWFFSLINVGLFDFAEPIANLITQFVKLFYDRNIEVGGIYVDGSLLLFDFIALIAVFVLSKCKYYIYCFIDDVELFKEKCKARIEEKFNQQLQADIEQELKNSNKAAILVHFRAKNMFVNATWGGDKNAGVKEKVDEAYKILYMVLKNISGCSFAKSGENILILLDDFSKIDNVLTFVYGAITRIRVNARKRHWLITANIAADAYSDNMDLKADVMPVLNGLLLIDHKNEAVCLGNFCMRYELNEKRDFSIIKRGVFTIASCENEVWTLVKKD